MINPCASPFITSQAGTSLGSMLPLGLASLVLWSGAAGPSKASPFRTLNAVLTHPCWPVPLPILGISCSVLWPWDVGDGKYGQVTGLALTLLCWLRGIVDKSKTQLSRWFLCVTSIY
jgi:hypothetical protein